MVDEMISKYPDNKFIAVGFSMGGNIVVKYLGEHEHVQSRFIGAISCCQGYDLVESVSLCVFVKKLYTRVKLLNHSRSLGGNILRDAHFIHIL